MKGSNPLHTPLCDRLGIEVPLFAFSRSPEVVVEVCKAGGMGVLGAISFEADELAEHLDWIDAHIGGRPYGVDVVMPASHAAKASEAPAALDALLPPAHRQFVVDLLDRYQVPALPEGSAAKGLLGWLPEKMAAQVEVVLTHPIRLLANALGPPPPQIVAAAHAKGVLVAALVGSVTHAKKQVEAGVDIIVAQGWEAGGHTGEVSTMVLVPEVVDALGDVPVLAAGGIGSGRQFAAALCLGAQGAWTGSIWLTAAESGTHPSVQARLLSASSSDTVRSRALTGKPARQLRTAWTEAWDAPSSPGPLPLPLQFLLTADAVTRLHTYADHPGAKILLGSPIGQIVGRMNAVRPTAEIMNDLITEARKVLTRGE